MSKEMKFYYNRGNFNEIIDSYLKKEKIENCYVIDVFGRRVITDFIDFIDEQRGNEEWELEEVTEDEGINYIKYLEKKKNRKVYVKKNYKPDIEETWTIDTKAEILNSFMAYSLSRGRVKNNPFEKVLNELNNREVKNEGRI